MAIRWQSSGILKPTIIKTWWQPYDNLRTTNIQGDALFQADGRSTGRPWSPPRPGALVWGSVPLSLISAGSKLTLSKIIWRNKISFIYLLLHLPYHQADKCPSCSCGGWTSHEPGISLCLFWATASSGLPQQSCHVLLHFFPNCLQLFNVVWGAPCLRAAVPPGLLCSSGRLLPHGRPVLQGQEGAGGAARPGRARTGHCPLLPPLQVSATTFACLLGCWNWMRNSNQQK